jgi:isochorismate synthase
MLKTLNYLVENKISFAAYSLPNSSDIYLIVDEQKNTKTGFVMQEFDSSNQEVIIGKDIFLKNEEIQIQAVNHLKQAVSEQAVFAEIKIFNQKEYEAYVALVVEKCKDGTFKKAVPARIISRDKPANFNMGAYFLSLVKAYENAFVNLYFHPSCGLWIGATPELLVKENKENTYETYSLAGTKLISKNRHWTVKEVEEQQIVTDYIAEALQYNNCKEIVVGKAKNIQAGLIEHLKSEITFSSQESIERIAKLLHPTPAVCGMPLKNSFDFIKEVEGSQRKNYTGFIGLNFANNQQLFVNLRCMQILKNNFLVYVGAGVTKDSIPENEWFETENKSMTLLKML